MAKSRMAVALTILLPGPAFAQSPAPEPPALTAEAAIRNQRRLVAEATGIDCRDPARDEIVVCGRRGPDPNRIPFPDQRAPGEPENLLPGELPRARTSFNSCMIACQQPVTITDKDVRKYGGRILRHILGKDD